MQDGLPMQSQNNKEEYYMKKNFTNHNMNSADELEKSAEILKRCNSHMEKAGFPNITKVNSKDSVYTLEENSGLISIKDHGYTQARISHCEDFGVFIEFHVFDSLEEILTAIPALS